MIHKGIKHLDAFRLEDGENAIWRHCEVDHEGRMTIFSVRILRIHRTALLQQVNEAVRIIISKAECSRNSKTEWHQAPLFSIIPMSGLQDVGPGGTL